MNAALIPALTALARAVRLLRQLVATAPAEQAPALARAIAELEAVRERLIENT
jgi:hypothetical protein